MPTEGIQFTILGTGSVNNSKVKFGEYLILMNLTLIQDFRGSEVSQILVICKNQNWKTCSMTIGSPMFEDFYHCQKFFSTGSIFLE
jgi:hypothetical protein